MTPTTIPHAPPARGPASPLLRVAEQALGLLRLAVSSIVVVLFVTMTASTLIQVAGRYVFGYAIAWTTEVATFSQIWLVFLASGIAMRYGMHIGVDVLAGMLPPPVQRLLAIVLGLASLVFLWVIFEGSHAIVRHGPVQTSPLLQVSIEHLPRDPDRRRYGAGVSRRHRPAPDGTGTVRAARGGGFAPMMVTFPVFLFFILMGMPIVFCLGVAAALTLHLTTSTPLVVLPQRLYSGLDSYTLLAIPFFIGAGLVMEMGGIARRIIEFATSLVGWITGGLLMVAVVAGAGLASISGSGSADTAAIASVMTPDMKRRRYNIDFAAGIMACAGALGPIIPPSIIMVIIATVSGLSVGRMFLGGVVPGLLMGLALLGACYLHARRNPGIYRDAEPFSAARVGRAFLAAIPALLMPVIIVGGIVGGVFTPTEAAAVVLFYGLVVGLFVYRELTFAMLPKLFLRAACTTAAVMLIIGTAAIFSWLIAVQDVPGTLSRFLKATAENPLIYLLFDNVLLLVVGMFRTSRLC
jgi:C4-dicarboxylate transporter DctM subunit